MSKILQRKVFQIQYTQKRNLWEWINMMFNRPDASRIKEVGPDRACAEWVLRNGGAIQWMGSDKDLRDYNSLPISSSLHIEKIDATGSSISHYGFEHLKGCKYIDKIILHNCSYIQDQALDQLSHVESPLTYLQISTCLNITDRGLKSLPKLNDLKVLSLENLPEVKNIKECEEYLKKIMPNCKLEINSSTL